MKHRQIEPGLLSLFRLTNGLWLLLYSMALLGGFFDPTDSFKPFNLLRVANAVVMLLYLYFGWLPHRLGKWYLPVGFFAAAAGAILAQWVEMEWRIQHDVPADRIFDEDLGLVVPLFIPMIIVSAQYNLRVMIGFLVGTGVLQVALSLTFLSAGSEPVGAIWGDVIAQLIILPIAGFLVVRVVGGQKTERAALAEKNVQLTHYATTVERLVVSHERNRLARELHDTIAHALSAVAVQLEALNKQIDTDPNGAKQTLDQSRKLIRSGLQETRRALQALRASPLEDLGLALAMRQLVNSVAERNGLQITLDLPDELDELSPEVEQGIYRITEEALNNTVRHARAHQATVSLAHEHYQLCLTITDNGFGFNPDDVSPNEHYGLVGMRERALLCNGHLDIESAPVIGTTVRLTIEE
ncbi:MAG TPA: sensor histidine kinase [Aggregatilineaceae bacterium]|nr:sensor histidine kinase [Aggregatilineaceae bacterium]